VDIQAETEAKSALGGTSKSWATLYIDVDAKVSPLNGESIEAYARKGWTATDAIYLSDDYGLQPNVHRLTIEAQQFIIRGVEHFKGGSLEHWKVIAERKPNS